jgi:hypothetical protein
VALCHLINLQRLAHDFSPRLGHAPILHFSASASALLDFAEAQ